MAKNYYIVDDEGQIVSDLGEDIDNAVFTRLDPNDVVIKRGTGVGLEETKEVELDFAKINYKAGMELYQRCPQALMILPFINFTDNVLKYSNGTLVSATNFAKHTGYNKDYVVQVFKKLRDNRVIELTRFDGKIAYVVNPYVFFKGKKMTVSTLNKFENTDWQILGKKRKGKANGKESK